MQLYAESGRPFAWAGPIKRLGKSVEALLVLIARSPLFYMIIISLMLTSGGDMHTAGILVTTAAAYTVLLWQPSGVKNTPLRTINSHEAAQPGAILARLSGIAALRLQCDGDFQQPYMLMLCCSVLT